MLKKNLKAILTIALLGAVLGTLPSCQKDDKEPVSNTPQLAGTHWEGTITFNDTDTLLEPNVFDYSMLFFSSLEGEATIPRFRQNVEDVQRFVVPFEYTIGTSYIKLKPIPAGSDPWKAYSIRECLSGTWLLKELSANKMTFYRSPGSEVVVTLNKVQL